MTKYKQIWYIYRILCCLGIHKRWDVYNCGLYEEWICIFCHKKELRPKWNLIIDHKGWNEEEERTAHE